MRGGGLAPAASAPPAESVQRSSPPTIHDDARSPRRVPLKSIAAWRRPVGTYAARAWRPAACAARSFSAARCSSGRAASGFGKEPLEIERSARTRRRRSSVRNNGPLNIDRRAHDFVQLRATDGRVSARLDRALLQVGDVDLEREHVGVGCHAGVTPALGPGEIFAGRVERRGRRAAVACAVTMRPNAASRSRRSPMRLRQPPGRRAAAAAGLGGGGASASAVEHQLLDGNRRLEEPDRVGMIERVDGEVSRREPARRRAGS